MDSQTVHPPRNSRFSRFALLVLFLAAFFGVWLASDVLYPNFILPEEISLVVHLRDGVLFSYGEKLLASPVLPHLFGRGLFFVAGESFPPLLVALSAVPLFALLFFLVRRLAAPVPFRVALLMVAVASLPLAIFLTSSPGLTLALAMAGSAVYCLLSYALRETVFHLFVAGLCIGVLPFAEPFFLYYILGLVPLLWTLLPGAPPPGRMAPAPMDLRSGALSPCSPRLGLWGGGSRESVVDSSVSRPVGNGAGRFLLLCRVRRDGFGKRFPPLQEPRERTLDVPYLLVRSRSPSGSDVALRR